MKTTKPLLLKKRNTFSSRIATIAVLFTLLTLSGYSQKTSVLINSYTDDIEEIKQQTFLPYKKISTISLNFDLFTKKIQNVGDKIMVDLFDNQSYSTTIDRVDININGSLTIRARFDDYPMGYMLISYTDNNVLGTISIPEKNERYSIKSFAKT